MECRQITKNNLQRDFEFYRTWVKLRTAKSIESTAGKHSSLVQIEILHWVTFR